MAGYKRPVTPAERAKRDEAREDKLSALHERLHDQVQALRSGEDWKRWLQVAAKFHNYSFNNTLLIYAQRPDATAVAGFQAWKTLGRQVDKGQKGIQILAPVVRRTTTTTATTAAAAAGEGDSGAAAAAEDTDQTTKRLAGFRVAHVWDVRQTSGEPLPERPTPVLLQGQAPDGLWDALAAQVEARGFTFERGNCSGSNGYTDFARNVVRVRDDVDDAQAVKTLAHELGHVLLHDPRTPGDAGSPTVGLTTSGCRGVVEVEAESVAYLVATTHGLATDDYTFAYVAGWAGSVNGTEPEAVVRATGQRVLAAANEVITATTPELAAADVVDVDLAERIATGAQRTSDLRARTEDLTAAEASAPATGVSDEQLERLYAIHEVATDFYAAQLASPECSRAAAMLRERGISDPFLIEGERLGYAPRSWTALTDHLRRGGFTDEELLASGLGFATSRGTIVDRFRDRVMFPVHDLDRRDPAAPAKVVAFLGRSLDTNAGSDGGAPKYLNSPETEIYRKSHLLYGLHGPGHAVARLRAGASTAVLVEGPIDRLAVNAAGSAAGYTAVAPCGTALTEHHVRQLLAATNQPRPQIIVAFDADNAGRAASVNAYTQLTAAGAWPVRADLPDRLDPAATATSCGQDQLVDALHAAAQHPLVDLVIDERLHRWTSRLHTAEGRVGAVRDIAPIIAALPVEQVGRQVGRVAVVYGLDAGSVTASITELVSPGVMPGGTLSAGNGGSSGQAAQQRHGPPGPVTDYPIALRESVDVVGVATRSVGTAATAAAGAQPASARRHQIA